MGPKPFTLEEAAEISEDFDDLKDTEFRLNASPLLLIEDIVIAPFSASDKHSFLNHYLSTKNKETALALYKGSDYDVLLITSTDGPDKLLNHIDIRTFADLRGIKYSFPE